MEQEQVETRKGIGGYNSEKGVPTYHGLATGKGYSQEDQRIMKTSYSHEAMIDMIIAQPRVTQAQLAANFGYSTQWVSRVIGSDAFQAALAKRRAEVTDPFLIATVDERLRGLAMQSLDVIADKLVATNSADIALKALDITTKALGFGARDRASGGVQNNFVVQMPGKAASAEEWAKSYTIDVTPVKGSDPQNFSTTVDRDPTVQPTPTQLSQED